MNPNLQCLDLNTLKALYDNETDDLNAALLRGEDWDNLKNERKRIMDIAMVLRAKRTGEEGSNEHPAGFPSRK
ncbi:MAG: hypothetical protein ACJ75F_09715 [Flavisolibacter sp.]|jgi:hypothetical protein